jgi:dsRNA-specific ribonuclease
MKRLRLERWTGHLLSSKARPCCLRQHQQYQMSFASTRPQSTSPAVETIENNIDILSDNTPSEIEIRSIPSPPPEAALSSAKLSALHARLSLPKKLPLQTLSRTLIDRSADSSSNFNNASLAQVGSSLLSYHVSEWLLCTYPRLPMTVLFSAMSAYVGPPTLRKIGQEWGVEAAVAPGEEVDPGLLQYNPLRPGTSPALGASIRPDYSEYYRRGISSRVIYDDEFGDLIKKENKEDPQHAEAAYATFVRALVGSIYLHAGRKAATAFIKSHILSRYLPISKLFEFKTATRDLSRLCAREDFEYPIARLLSETGRYSRSPVYVVGIFSGTEKLGEAAGASLNEARTRAAIAALKAWYLYSPNAGSETRVPSDAEDGQGKGNWEPVHIDLGEII